MIQPLLIAARMAGREFRSGELSVLIAALLVAVASSTAIGILGDRLNRTMAQQAAEFLAADLVVAGHDPVPADWRSKASELGLRHGQTVVFPSVLTARDEIGEKVLALDAGADDYVTKPFHLAELLARVRSLLHRAKDVPTGLLRVGELTLDLRNRVLSIGGRKIDLTGRELGLLELLMRNAGRVVTRTEILDQVWGMHFDPESNVIEVHMRRLREKLGDVAQALETVRGQGYRLVLGGDER